MSEANFETIARYTQKKLGDGKGPALSVVEWIKSSILNWAHSASISSFAPVDSQMSRDKSFDDLLLDLMETLQEEREFDGFNSRLLICSALADALEILRDQNYEWETSRDKNNDEDFADASLLTATTLAVFRTLQHFDSERAMRWADHLLRSDGASVGFLSFSTHPFAITLFSLIDQKHAKTEARSGFFIALYEWAERNTINPQVISRFPELFLKRLEAAHGAKIDEQQFDILCSVFSKRSVDNLQPIQVIDKSLCDEIDDFDDTAILTDYASELSDIADVHIARHVREMGGAEKRRWLESETLRNAFWKSLNSPPIPEYNPAPDNAGFDSASALGVILAGQAHAN